MKLNIENVSGFSADNLHEFMFSRDCSYDAEKTQRVLRHILREYRTSVETNERMFYEFLIPISGRKPSVTALVGGRTWKTPKTDLSLDQLK